MSILIDQDTAMLIIGITGKQGRIHCKRTLESKARLLAGVAPGKGGQSVEGVPVFETVADARAVFPEIRAAMLLVPKQFVRDAAFQALDEGIRLLAVITEFVPVMDALQIVHKAKALDAQVVGPNTIGVISPGKSKLGIMPDYIYGKGHIGIISRSGTLTHETASNLTFKGFGLSTCVGIGGDAVVGMDHADVIEYFAQDDETDAIVIIGEIGGTSEEMAAAKIKELNLKKPVCAYIAGMYAPENKRMGHAGAIVSGGMGTVRSKIAALEDAGAVICPTLGKIVEFMDEYNRRTGGRLQSLEPQIDG
ncbi:succinate--CoA ligase subunit alpha [[Clostridium] hylemonae]|uniref:Succinate-CoA ligase, alpha subunit n=2 Tax=[Clostridium] hylemonae DSM 15053 TaxID=553973 RepID=C0BZV5_9FIRM|nr:succinate--CoA ligase subunit alpha [[Clostridium] hylemonae]EEG74683.1 succinate-CoA ligase, alpha subunit [[Clostridium] hylemonae DSM 15053]QEK18705.1 Succinate--CoA ligase [ADP-forming] subunit alpha [[Clostridium] hylemonae DSM 15053]